MSFQADTHCVREVRSAVNFGDRAPHLKTDILLMHYTGMDTAENAINWLCCKESGVSCHYFVYEDGRIVQLVPEEKRAWHAGKSNWQGETDINSRSIGIEIVNPGHNWNYPDYPDVQIDAVTELSMDIIERHSIPAHQVLAHSDVAPGRKPDPGEKFPWKKLHEHGIGHWVEEQPAAFSGFFQLGDNGEPIAALQTMLAHYGYGIEASGVFDKEMRDCVVAFQRHFRQSNVDGVADGVTIATLDALIRAL
ncbi:MAG: N-acetylmuramoyl-L-alanine amidase [Pseudomonadota bacterium]